MSRDGRQKPSEGACCLIWVSQPCGIHTAAVGRWPFVYGSKKTIHLPLPSTPPILYQDIDDDDD